MQTPDRDLLLKQEMINSFLHALGILFGLVSIPLLISNAVQKNNTGSIIGTGIYGLSFLAVFTFSTLYHGFRQQKLKRLFKILDHISIYFMIAGTYTPLLLIYHNNSFGISLLIILWVLTFAGTIFKIFYCGKWEIISTMIYLLMGWSMLSGGWSFFKQMPDNVLIMVLLGGCLYSVGVIFYLWDKYIYNHAIWHICVLAAAVCHYVAILLSV